MKANLLTCITFLLAGIQFLDPVFVHICLAYPLEDFEPSKDETLFKNKSSTRLADHLLQIGSVYFESGDRERARSAWEQALEFYQKANDILGEAATLGNLGILYRDLNNYLKSIDFLTSSLNSYILVQDLNSIGLAYHHLGETYRLIGDYPKSEHFFLKALKTSQDVQNSTLESMSLMGLGALYAEQGNFSEASKYYHESFSVSETIENISMRIGILISLGSVYQALGNLELGIDYLAQGLILAKRYRLLYLEQVALSNLSLAYADIGDFPQAIQNAEDALSLARYNSDNRQIAMSLNNLGAIFLSASNLLFAEQYLRESIAAWNTIADELDDRQQLNIRDTLLPFDLLLKTLIHQGRYQEALEISEYSRSRASTNAFIRREDQAIDLSAHIGDGSPSIAELKNVASKENATIIEYFAVLDTELSFGKFRGKVGNVYIWVISPSGEVSFKDVPVSENDISLESLIRLSFESIGSRSRGGFQVTFQSQESQNQQLKKIYDLLVEPVEDFLPDSPFEKVIFIPHRELFMVPFAALMDSEGHYLIEKHTISIAPSIQILNLTREQQQLRLERQSLPPGLPLIIGNPEMPSIRFAPDEPAQPLVALANAEREALEVAKLLETSALTGSQATETLVKQRISDAEIIHLATHGLLEYGRPEDSGIRDIPGAIALTPDAEEDGLLTSAEILDMQLRADLAVLSACDTGRGEITDDGVNGLSRSFILAGVPSVVVSLWSVPDAPTAELMTEFYRQMQVERLDKAQALRQAMLKTMETHPHPRDWAAFTLVGSYQ